MGDDSAINTSEPGAPWQPGGIKGTPAEAHLLCKHGHAPAPPSGHTGRTHTVLNEHMLPLSSPALKAVGPRRP